MKNGQIKKIKKEDIKWKLADLRYLHARDRTLSWVSKDMWGDWLPFDNQMELNNAFKFLEKKMLFQCYRFRDEEHKYEKRNFEYIPVDVTTVLKEASRMPADKNSIGLKYKIALRFLDEKPS